jgi:hypothetical protein
MTTTRIRAGEANDQLTVALIKAAAHGIRPRCGDYETSHLFLSEDPHERRIATAMCSGCVVWAECDEVRRITVRCLGVGRQDQGNLQEASTMIMIAFLEKNGF